MQIDRRALIASLGGAAAVSLMSHEAKADALEHFMSHQLDLALEGQQAMPVMRRPGRRRNFQPSRSFRIRSKPGRSGAASVLPSWAEGATAAAK